MERSLSSIFDSKRTFAESPSGSLDGEEKNRYDIQREFLISSKGVKHNETLDLRADIHAVVCGFAGRMRQ